MAGPADAIKGPGSSQVQQLFLYQVVGQIVAILLSPAFNELSRAINRATTTVPLTPAQLADMVVRNIIDPQTGQIYASESGIKGEDFTRMVESAGDAPSPQELIAAFRRGLIPKDGTGPNVVSVQQGVAEGRTYNKYFEMLVGLSNVPLSPADAVDAVVESQIPYAAGEHIAYLNGISKEDFRILVDTRGNPPSPTELNVLYKRGLIPLRGTGPDALSVQQGIFEGDTKNKWWELLAALSDYIPPPRTVTAMVREGSLTDAQALKFYQQAGLTTELAGAYLASAHHQKTQPQRDLTVSNILTLYKDRIIDATEAHALLALLRYTDEEVAFLLDISDFEVEQQRTRSAVTRIHNLYVAHKIDATEATTALDGFHVPAAGRDKMISDWKIEREANVPELTRAEIVDAVFYEIIDVPTGVAKLGDLGWSQDDALTLIGIRFHGKPPPAPKP